MAKLFALIVVGIVASVAANSFLAKSDGMLRQEDVKRALLAELAGHTDVLRLHEIQDQLRPMFVALPKGQQGRLEMSTVRYALHRFFLRQHGWTVQGLDNAGESWNASGTTSVLKARAPAYIFSLFEEHLKGKGMGLHELAAFAATIADLVHAEAIGLLGQIYKALDLPTVGPVDPEQAESAVHNFVIAHLLGVGLTIETQQDLLGMKARLDYQYPNQEETNMWVRDFRQTYDWEQQAKRNPFVARQAGFDESSAFVVQFGQRFGSFQNLECHTLKRKLVEMEHAGSGRVLLSKFYSSALAGGWEFMESTEYLRNQGALDESDPNRPSVVIPNYMNSRMNCLTASDYYAVCCLNECDGLLDRLEAKIAAPRAESAHIARVISNLQSDTVDAPRNLSAALLARLDEIAQAHSGQVPLHGRLFTQWMHHAYPRECPFPHVSGVVQPMTPLEFAMEMGKEFLEASEEVMKMHAASSAEASDVPVVLPWSHEEELVAEHSFGVHRRSSLHASMHTAMHTLAALTALASFAVPIVRAVKVALSSDPRALESKAHTHFV